ncbi:MAG: helicase RepA family protein [Paracoccaceae bacterium]|nr:helicase RepA family protein [Paracoccaceae bacterium]
MNTPFTGISSASGIFNAADLQTKEFPPIQWTVPDVLPEGLTILAGKPKVGKFWLALDIAFAVAGGGAVLGRECDPGAVLYLALEDNERRLQRRLKLLEPCETWPAELEFKTNAQRLDQGEIKHLEDWIKTRDNPRLIIVDTLALVRPCGRANDSVHTSDYAALRGLHRLASDTGIAVLVIHHLRKIESDDPLDAVSGSTGLTGAADTTLVLNNRQADGGCILYGRGRDLEEFETGLDFDTEACRWNDVGDPIEAFASETRAAILDAVHAGCQTPAKVRDHTGLDHELVKKTMQRMEGSELKKTGRGIYAASHDPLSPVSPCPRSDANGDKGTEGTLPRKANGPDPDALDPEAWR